MQRFQDPNAPIPPPPTMPSTNGATLAAGNGGVMNGSANGGTIANGLYMIIDGVYYPVANGGTVIGSADGGSGNSASMTMPSPAPAAPPTGSAPPPGAIEDPNGGPPSPDSVMRRYGMPPAPPRNPRY